MCYYLNVQFQGQRVKLDTCYWSRKGEYIRVALGRRNGDRNISVTLTCFFSPLIKSSYTLGTALL